MMRNQRYSRQWPPQLGMLLDLAFERSGLMSECSLTLI